MVIYYVIAFFALPVKACFSACNSHLSSISYGFEKNLLILFLNSSFPSNRPCVIQSAESLLYRTCRFDSIYAQGSKNV